MRVAPGDLGTTGWAVTQGQKPGARKVKAPLGEAGLSKWPLRG
mgnify:CR=1 FL=1